MAATGLPGKPINGVLFMLPKANGLPGLIDNLQKLIFPFSLRNFPILSVWLVEIPPLVTKTSICLIFIKIFFFVSLKLSFIIPKSITSHPILLNKEHNTNLLLS